jgi:predicted RNA binding protein YcfA (HicA-like mRNA interferase family)
MTRLTRVDGKTVISALAKIGFDVARIKGSHHFLRHPDGRVTKASLHSGETIVPGLLNKILNDCDISREEFERLL